MQYFPSMFFLMKMDPLTFQAFVFICPDHELGSLFALISPHVATTWVLYLLHEFRYRPSTKDDVSHVYTVLYRDYTHPNCMLQSSYRLNFENS